ncbi:2-keto-4-pentenoate hydratase [Magnetospirillum sp. LM-5]|uniref:2-keto-4-pentenoate hydratase n=1 Tax=Magnetospirillum sp. LM-5 TaxID=2681466 RepID=UPI00156E20B2|nr:fumarylacetoacetate hydrolase family protein [Magnetospirillum sp. LM-5]
MAGLVVLGSVPAVAGCPDAAQVSAYVAEFAAKNPSRGFGKTITEAEALCAQGRLIPELPPVLGPRVGYKALFTNPDSQKRFGVAGPAWGAMFAGQMVTSGAVVPANFGAKPRYEADFVVVVKDAALADARTPAEALAHISALVPFVELPDLMIEGTPTGPELIATNAAFRGGVMGAAILVDGAGADLAAALATMQVTITEEISGKELGREKGAVLMGHPLNAAIWLAGAVRAAGQPLKAGDLLSLGGFQGSAPTRPGTRITVRYHGLPGDPAVTVAFAGSP